MSTDMQTFLTGRLSATNHAAPDAKDHNLGVSPAASSNRFDSILGTAQARRREPAYEPMASRAKQTIRPRTASHGTSTSQPDRSARTNETRRQEKSGTQGERIRSEKIDGSDAKQDDQSAEGSDKSSQTDGGSPEMVLAAGLIQSASKDSQSGTDTTSSPADRASEVHGTSEESGPRQAFGSTSQESPSVSTPQQSAFTFPSDQVSGQTPAEEGRSADPKSIVEQPKASDSPISPNSTSEATRLTDVTGQNAPAESATTVKDGSPKEIDAQPEKTTPAVTVTASHITAKPGAVANATDYSDLQSPFETVMGTNGVAGGQGASNAEQFLSQDRQSSSESRNGLDHPKSNHLPSEDKTLRPQFLDPATGASPSAPNSSENRIGRGDGGQVATTHLSESERINDLRSAFPSAQTVTLDLDPLDIGPLRVRIMMSDQTVHAHIRTEHGELGQSLLQQGQSLEASLRTTGFEMGMLRVTVDQQQQGHGERGWAFQQQQNRPGLASDLPAPPAEEDRVIRAGQGLYNDGQVSFFA